MEESKLSPPTRTGDVEWNWTSWAFSKVIGFPMVSDGMIAVARKTSRSSCVPELIFWSGSTKDTENLVPGVNDWNPLPIFKVGFSKDTVADEEPAKTEIEFLLYVIEPVCPLGASDKIPRVDWSLLSPVSKIPEFGPFSTSVTISEYVIVPSVTLILGCSLLDCNSRTEFRLTDNFPLSSKPILERLEIKSTNPVAELCPFSSYAW